MSRLEIRQFKANLFPGLARGDCFPGGADALLSRAELSNHGLALLPYLLYGRQRNFHASSNYRQHSLCRSDGVGRHYHHCSSPGSAQYRASRAARCLNCRLLFSDSITRMCVPATGTREEYSLEEKNGIGCGTFGPPSSYGGPAKCTTLSGCSAAEACYCAGNSTNLA